VAAIALTDGAHSAGIEAFTRTPDRDFNEDFRPFGLGALRTTLRIELVPRDVARFMLMRPREGTSGAGSSAIVAGQARLACR